MSNHFIHLAVASERDNTRQVEKAKFKMKLTRSISRELMFGLIPERLLELRDRDGIVNDNDNDSGGVTRDAEVGEVHRDGGKNGVVDEAVKPCDDDDGDSAVEHPVGNVNGGGLGGGVVTSLSSRT